MQWRILAIGAIGIGLAGCSASASPEASPVEATMQLTSPAFAAGEAIPTRYGCDGDGVSPPLAWSDVPDGVAAFALIVTDPDAGGFVHWVLVDIPGDLRELPEGQGDAMGVAGPNSFGDVGWGGPCPPSGEHRYVFELLALTEPLRIGVERTEARVRSAADGLTLARGELAGTYAR